MKYATAAISLLVSLSCANALMESAEIYYEQAAIGASMWHFSSDGLTIYSPDGKTEIKKHNMNPMCGDRDSCNWFNMRSDGHKYVWAADTGDNTIRMFDINTGDFVGYQPTCSTPLDLEYHGSRREMWVRCAGVGSIEGGIDVYSTDVLGLDHAGTYVENITSSREYGRMATHTTMQGRAYATAYNVPFLTEVDVSARMDVAKYVIPLTNGLYDIVYSAINEHLFIRTRPCCDCTQSTCRTTDRQGNPINITQVLVQTGPSASLDMQGGGCGTSCKGTTADTQPIIEFDTVSKTIVATHNIKEGTGNGAEPIVSPNGEYIVLYPYDGGEFVRILAPGAKGAASSVMMDIPVEFKGFADNRGRQVVTDCAFVKDAERNIMIIASSSDNDIVLVDMNDNYRTKKLTVDNSEESTESSTRRVEWAVGTDFVWISGKEEKRAYVVDLGGGIDDATLSFGIEDMTAGEFLFINNYERLAAVETLAAAIAAIPEPPASEDSSDSSDSSKSEDKTNFEAQQQIVYEKDDDDDWVKVVSIAALCVGSIALLTTMFLLFSKLTSTDVPASAASPERPEEPAMDDEKTLGSKLVA